VEKIDVVLMGPIAITHISVCGERKDTTAPTVAKCIPEAKLIDKSVLTGSTGDYQSNPVKIIYQAHSTVRFQIAQNWVNGDVGWIAVNYQPPDSIVEICHTSESVANGYFTPGYTAKCFNGFAKVDVFVYDCTFVDVSEIVMPDSCGAWVEEGKKVAFHFTIPCDPQPVNGDGICSDPVCVPEARLVQKSIGTGMYGDILSNPVNIVHYGVDSVKFRIDQNWKDDELGWISVMYVPVDAVNPKCDSIEGIAAVSSTPVYTAKCVNGVAEIDIFAYDCTFTDVPTIDVGIPDSCKAWSGSEKTTHFRFTVPCDRNNSSYCADKPKCIPTARVDHKSVINGGQGDYKAMPITILHQGGTVVHFQLEQKWKSDGDLGWISVHYSPADGSDSAALSCSSTEAISPGHSSPVYQALCSNGVAEIDVYVFDCTFNDVVNIDAYVPASCQPLSDIGKKAHFHFTVPCLCVEDVSQLPPPKSKTLPISPTVAPIQSAPVVKPSASMATSSPTWTPYTIATNKLECSKVIFEDFETKGQSDSWTYGSEYHDSAFTTFLGRLGKGHNEVSKIFEIPKEAKSLELSFDFYDIDGMPSEDRVFVGVQGSYLDLKLFGSPGATAFYGDIQVTGSLKQQTKISFNFDRDDAVYSVSLQIPEHWYKYHGYKLPVAFKIETSKDISIESYGIDNFRLQAKCTGRKLESEGTDETVDDGVPYCSSKDFPCEGEGMVQICHFTPRKGYETFCVPEADSEVLRFYSHDYCGPCVGGFGGVNMQG
jgi:hypothetical protein